MAYDDDNWEWERAAEVKRQALRHEVESYGIADGMLRRPGDPDYIREDGYVDGYRRGHSMAEREAARAVGGEDWEDFQEEQAYNRKGSGEVPSSWGYEAEDEGLSHSTEGWPPHGHFTELPEYRFGYKCGEAASRAGE